MKCAPPSGRAGKHQQGTGPGKSPKGQRRDHVTTAPRTASRPGSHRATDALAAVPSSGPSSLSRAAVIGVTSHADATASAANHLLRSAGVGAGHLADVPAAVDLPSLTKAPETATDLSSLAVYSSFSAVCAHDVSRRAPLASAGSSDARTQGGPERGVSKQSQSDSSCAAREARSVLLSSATWADRGQSSAPIRRRQWCAVVNGVGTVVTAGNWVPAGLIEKQSIRPAAVPAGTTQGRDQ
jgi:hypothetical protein